MIQFQIKTHKEKEAFWGEFIDFPGCFTTGDTLADLLENGREVLSLRLEDARDPEWKIPTPNKIKCKGQYWVQPYEDVAIPLMIRKARQKKNIGQRKLANILGISVQQLQRLETPGKSNPTVKTLAAISKALNEKLIIKLAA